MNTYNETMDKVKSASPYFSREDAHSIALDVQEILESGNLILGPYLRRFEDGFAKYVGTKYAVGFSSCTAALEVALRFFDVRNSEVIVPTNTFIACPNSITFAGGIPKFSDIESQTYNMCLDGMNAKIDKSTKGVMAVHLGGLPIREIDAIRDTCKDKGMFLIEDCSHAHGAMIGNRKVGSIGDVGCFSLMATKIMTSGLGGMLTTNNGQLYEFAQSVRNSAAGKSAEIKHLASDWLMSEVSAAIGIRQLGSLDMFLRARNSIAKAYKEELANIGAVKFYEPLSNIRQSYYKFLITIDNGVDKAKLIGDAKSQGIELGTLYETPCHMQPVYKSMGYAAGECPLAEELLKHQIALPMHARITEEDVRRVSSFIKEAVR